MQLIGIMSDAPHPTGTFHHAEAEQVRQRLGLESGSFAIIRPDGYLALLGDAANTKCMTNWLESLEQVDGSP